MVRRTRIVVVAGIAAGVLSGAALAPAAGDRNATGSSSPRVTYTEDGIPVVDSGHECNAGKAGAKKHHRSYSVDPSDY